MIVVEHPVVIKPRIDRLQAMKVTEDSLEDVALWCSGFPKRNRTTQWVNVPSLGGTLHALVGDWVVYDGQNFDVLIPEVFHRTYVVAEFSSHD